MTTRLWDTDDEYSVAAQTGLATPTDTPRTRTPSRTSKKSKRNSNLYASVTSSPAMRRNSRDSVINDEPVSVLDPRRFTPELHASLVNEILKLRGDQEEKIRLVESLESRLNEEIKIREGLEQTLGANGKETRSLKRQLDLLEGGTSSAIKELESERDEAVESASDIKRRLESVQKKQRSQEEDLDRTNDLYTRDKENWGAEKRSLERQIHVVEGRLKAVLTAVQQKQDEDEEMAKGLEHGNTNELDRVSLRSLSITHSRNNSIQFSGVDYKGISLADELDMDTDVDEEMDGSRESSLSINRRHRDSRLSWPKTHKRNFSSFSGIPEKEYVDTGVQPSPKLEPTALPEIFESEPERRALPELAPRESEVEANQRRKRIHPPSMVDPKPLVVSSGCQTLEVSPPEPTRDDPSSEQRDAEATPASASTASVSTQTDPLDVNPPSLSRSAPLFVPMISVHPPDSRPSTPRPPGTLPAYFKDASCQVFLHSSASYCSTAMQTETRVQERMNLLPANLQPSTISSAPPTPERESEICAIPPKSPRRVTSHTGFQSRDPPSSPPPVEYSPAYPKKSDKRPSSKHKLSVRRPRRMSSLGAGLDDKSSDEGDFAEGELSDNDFRTALSAPKPLSRVTTPTFAPEDKVVANADLHLPTWTGLNERRSPTGSFVLGTAKHATMRKAALISRGVTAHAAGQLGLEDGDPPFPIPNRSSSRQPLYRHAPSDRSGSPTSVDSVHDDGPKSRSDSRSPPLFSISTQGPRSPQLPRLPKGERTSFSPYFDESARRKTQPPAETTGNISTNFQGSSVVDSIAQTMVGEWMLKYVRRRKSFGVSENKNVDETAANGSRHRRWVWLAPYDKAIMWSSKQPTSGSALLGKSGRKLIIQSVLDVKDDNPVAKNAGQTAFNRSILIVTAARALKFTAVNSERHHIWLSALSFLAHSSQAVPDIPISSRPKIPPFEVPMKSAARFRRNPIRDSIRVAKANHAGPPSASQYSGSTNGSYSVRSQTSTDLPSARPQHGHARELSGVAVPRYGGRGIRGDYLDHRDTGRGYQNPCAERKRNSTTSRIRKYRACLSPGPVETTPALPPIAGSSPVRHATSADGYSYGDGDGPLSPTDTAATYVSPSRRSSLRALDAPDPVGTVRMEAFISPMSRFSSRDPDRGFEDYAPAGGPGSEVSWDGGGGSGTPGREAALDRRSRARRRSRQLGEGAHANGGRHRVSGEPYGGGWRSPVTAEEDSSFRGF